MTGISNPGVSQSGGYVTGDAPAQVAAGTIVTDVEYADLETAADYLYDRLILNTGAGSSGLPVRAAGAPVAAADINAIAAKVNAIATTNLQTVFGSNPWHYNHTNHVNHGSTA